MIAKAILKHQLKVIVVRCTAKNKKLQFILKSILQHIEKIYLSYEKGGIVIWFMLIVLGLGSFHI